MKRDIHDALASYAGDYSVRRLLNDVPPHRVYEVTVDGVRAVCKLGCEERASPSVEGRIIEHLETETSVPVPPVIDVGDGYFLTEWCADAPDEQISITGSEASALGVCLATIHDQTSFERTGVLRASDGLTVDGHDRWSETLTAIITDVHDDLTGTGYEDVSERVRSFVDDHRAFFDEAGPAVLVHGGLTQRHAGFDDGAVSRVVDFEHAIAGPGEFDYARTDLHVFDNPACENEHHRDAFRAGYESVRELPSGSGLRRRAYKALLFAYNIRQGFVQRQRSEADRRELSDSFRRHAFDILDDVEAAITE